MRFLILVIPLMMFLSCSPQQTEETVSNEPAFDFNAEMAAIEATRSGFMQAIKEKRYGDLRQFGMRDVISITPNCGEWEEYKKLRSNPSELFSYDSIIMSPEETVIVSDSVAYDFGTSIVYYTNNDGEAVQIRDTFLAIVKKDKTDGQWKLFREVATTNMER